MTDLLIETAMNGTYQEWLVAVGGDHWEAVHDVSTDTYVSTPGPTAGVLTETYRGLPSVMAGLISNARVTLHWSQLGQTAYAITPCIYTHETLCVDPTDHTHTNGTITKDYAVNPITNSRWTWSEIYALEFGAQKQFTGGPVGGYLYLYYASCTITYAYTTSNEAPIVMMM